MTNTIKQYLRELSALIPKSYPNKSLFLKDIETNILLYFKEHPNASWQEILTEFGSPSEVAGSILAEHTDIKHSVTTKPRLHLRFIIIVVSIMVVLSIFAFEYYWEHFKMYRTGPAHYIYNGEEVSSEEFSQLTDF
ncbi:MAG: hypothetical protein V8S28_07205 [Lachnospiraceae bacterium]|jgi:hypothetical protein